MENMSKLTEMERRVIWIALNNAQGPGMNFMLGYESDTISNTPENELWYSETREEFRILQKAKKFFEGADK